MRIRPKKTTRQDNLNIIAEQEGVGRLLVEGKPEGWKRGDGSIVPGIRGERTWWYLYIGIDGKRRAFAHETVEQAIEHQRALRIRGESSGRASVDAYLTRWLDAHIARGSLRPKSAERYRSAIIVMLPYFKGLPLRSLSPRIVQSTLDKLSKVTNGRGGTLSAGSVAKVRAVLRAALNAAVNEGLIEHNPAIGVKLPRSSRVVPTLWNADERLKFIEAIKDDRLEALYLTALWQGLRQGELIGLRWQDIDFKRRKLTVAQQIQWQGKPLQAVVTDLKTEGSYRTISLHPAVWDALTQKRTATTGYKGPLVFPSTRGTALEPTNLLRSFRLIVERAGLPRIRFHDLRRLCATQMALDNVPVRVAMRFLGHSSITTTMNLYASVGEQDEAAALDKVWR